MSTDPSAKPPGKGKPLTGAISKPAAPTTPGITEEGAKPPPLTGAGGPVAFEFEDAPAEPAKKKSYAPPPAAPEPQPARGRAGEAAPAPARTRAAEPPPPEEDVDPDTKPGSRKDLWLCPHCGAGNRPGRPTCRTCGKSPEEAVVVPWFKQPVKLAAIGGGVLVLVLLVVLLRSGVDLSLKPAQAGNIDSAVRVGKHGSTHGMDGGMSFQGSKRFAVCGRCIATAVNASVPGAFDCVLLLGSTAASDTDSTAVFPSSGGAVQVNTSLPYVLLHLVPNPDVPLHQPGIGVVSITGEAGRMDQIEQGLNGYTVLVDGQLP